LDSLPFTADDGFRLQAGSPAINAGMDVGYSYDISGDRIEGTADIGAYEYIANHVRKRNDQDRINKPRLPYTNPLPSDIREIIGDKDVFNLSGKRIAPTGAFFNGVYIIKFKDDKSYRKISVIN
jgi:hypothetical protein